MGILDVRSNHHPGELGVLTDPVEKAKDIVHAVEHPVETAKAPQHEAAEGSRPRTPQLARTGTAIFLGVIFAILVTVALVVYFAYGGK
jgi:hypothetical protein